MPLISILTVPLPSGVAGPLAVNTVRNDLSFGAYDSKFARVYIIYNAAPLSKYQEYQSSPDLIERAITESTGLSSWFLPLEGLSSGCFI